MGDDDDDDDDDDGSRGDGARDAIRDDGGAKNAQNTLP